MIFLLKTSYEDAIVNYMNQVCDMQIEDGKNVDHRIYGVQALVV